MWIFYCDMRIRMESFVVLVAFSLSIQRTAAIAKSVSHSCLAKVNNVNLVEIQFRILQNDDPIYKVYAFDASKGDTSMSLNRISDAACIKDTTDVTDKYTTPITLTINVLTTDATLACGASVTTEGGVKIVTLLFRVYAYSDSLLSVEDDSYRVRCRMDDLTGAFVSSEELDTSAGAVITVLEPQNGAYLLVRKEGDFRPVSTATVGDKVFLSVEFNPQIELGPDNYGTHFFIGFLGNDPITGNSSSQLYIVLYPRYAVRTDITVTTMHGEQHYVRLDGTAMKLILPSDLMGCSDDGVADIGNLGVEINSYEMEIGVLVCNVETDSADCYTALPDDVTGNAYVTASMFAADEASEFMIITQKDATTVTITVPLGSSHVVTLNGSQTNAGGSLSITLNKRQTLHLVQTKTDATKSHVNGYVITSTKPVSVISGNRIFANDHLSEQLLPISKFGTQYVLTPADPRNDGRTTTYIIQASQTGETVVKRYLTSSTFDTHNITLTTYPPLRIDVSAGTPCELTSDKPILVTQVVNQPVASGFESAMVVMPSVSQWAPKYTMHHQDFMVTMVAVFKSNTDASKYRVNNIPLNLLTTAVIGPSGYVFGSGSTLPQNMTYVIKMSDDITTMMVIAYASSGQPASSVLGAAFLPFGYRYSDYQDCYKVGRRGDLRDNDCDGLIDEELVNSLDDDGDGAVDEDTVASATEHSGAVAIRPVNCKVSGDSSFPVGSTTLQITGADGCKAAGTGPFKPATDFVPQNGTNIGTGTKHKILYSGVFELAMFLDKPKLYFICDIDKYCTSAADTMCTSGVCSVVRVRREVTDQQTNNVTNDVWVFPYNKSKEKVTIQEIYRDATVQACMNNTHVKVIFSLILITAVLSFLTAVCFCCLFRRRNNKDKNKSQRTTSGGFYAWRKKSF